jgi:hypothetical protein
MKAAHQIKRYLIGGWITLVLLLGIGSQPSTIRTTPYLAATEVVHQPVTLKNHFLLSPNIAKSVKFLLPEVPFPIRLFDYTQRVELALKTRLHHQAYDPAKIGYAHQRASLNSEDTAAASA